MKPRGIILSGGPASLYEENAPNVSRDILDLGCPILGICYGLYVIAHHHGVSTPGSKRREYGPAMLKIETDDELFRGIDGKEHRVWMSHGDRVESLPETLEPIACSDNSPYAAVRS